MEDKRQQLLRLVAEQTRREIISNVTQQFTTEAHHNYLQYVRSVHAATVSAQVNEEKIKEVLRQELENTSVAVENWLRTTYGRIQLPTDTPNVLDSQTLNDLRSLR